MAEQYFFFNSVIGDEREYDQNQFSLALKHIADSNGISDVDHEDPLLAERQPNGDITIRAGAMVVEGYVYVNDDVLILPGPSYIQDELRTDRVIVRLDRSIDVRRITAQVLQGEAGSATPPELTRSNNIYDMCLATIKWDGVTATVEDTRTDTVVCGFIRDQYATHAEMQSFRADTSAELQQLGNSIVEDVNTLVRDVGERLVEVEEQIESIEASVEASLNTQNAAVTQQLQAQDTAVTQQINTQNQAITQQLAAQDQAVTQQLAAQDQRVNDALAAKADRATEIPVTIPAGAWQGSAAPYTAEIDAAGITATTKGEIGLSSSATTAEREAVRAAMITPTGTGTDKVFLVADGDKPGIDLPAVVTVLG